MASTNHCGGPCCFSFSKASSMGEFISAWGGRGDDQWLNHPSLARLVGTSTKNTGKYTNGGQNNLFILMPAPLGSSPNSSFWILRSTVRRLIQNKGIGIGWSPIGNEVCIPLIKAEAKQVQSSTIILGWNNMKEHNMSHHQPEVWYNHGSWEQFQTPIFMHGYPGSFWKDSPTTPAFAPYRDRLHQRTGRPGRWKVEREPTFSSLGR